MLWDRNCRSINPVFKEGLFHFWVKRLSPLLRQSGKPLRHFLSPIYKIRQFLFNNNWQKPPFGDSQNYVEGKGGNRGIMEIKEMECQDP
jgi:hypothetical protein